MISAGIKKVVYSKEYRLSDGVDLLHKFGIDVVHLPIEDI
jgi:dCMP deaminase